MTVRECLRQGLTVVNECVLLEIQQKRDASKQSKLVASVCGEGETVVSAKDEEIDLHMMDVDVLEARYARHELVNGTQN
jgi:hypothetical protein